MKQPLRLIIHVPLREERDYRKVLVGLKHALCVTVDGPISTYDLLPVFKPRKGQEHRIVEHLAEQISAGWTLMIWGKEALLRDCGQIIADRKTSHPKDLSVQAAWGFLQAADDEIVELGAFQRFPDGHYLALVAARENFDYGAYYRRTRRRVPDTRPRRPASEDFWGVLFRLLLSKSEADLAWNSYQRWVKSNRPRPPQQDLLETKRT